MTRRELSKETSRSASAEKSVKADTYVGYSTMKPAKPGKKEQTQQISSVLSYRDLGSRVTNFDDKRFRYPSNEVNRTYSLETIKYIDAAEEHSARAMRHQNLYRLHGLDLSTPEDSAHERHATLRNTNSGSSAVTPQA